MERLTWRSSVDGYEDVALKDGVSTGDAICQLADYEDTGLEPPEIVDLKQIWDMYGGEFGINSLLKELEAYRTIGNLEHIQEFVQAEKDGRLVVLPCKAGDLLYEVDLPKYGVITCKVLHVGPYNGPEAHVPGNPMVSAVSVGVEVVEGHGKGSGYAFEAEDFGKTVFLTREEAEAALEKREEADNEPD